MRENRCEMIFENRYFLDEASKTSVGLYKVSRASNSTELTHSAVEIKYFYEGNTCLVVASENIVAQPGDIVIVNPYEIHSTIYLPGQEGKYHILMIHPDFLSVVNGDDLDLSSLLFGKQLRFKHLIRENRRLQTILLEIAKEVEEGGDYCRFVIKGLLLEFFALLLRNEVDTENKNAVQADAMKYYKVIEPALCKIRDSYAERITVSGLADLCNVSKAHFCRIFKLVTNMTVVQYLTDYRFKVANLMLEHSDKSIAEIARICGIEDEGYFCRIYKKRYGISPNKNRIWRD